MVVGVVAWSAFWGGGWGEVGGGGPGRRGVTSFWGSDGGAWFC